jgi:hypothetical protein
LLPSWNKLGGAGTKGRTKSMGASLMPARMALFCVLFEHQIWLPWQSVFWVCMAKGVCFVCFFIYMFCVLFRAVSSDHETLQTPDAIGNVC